MVGNHHEKVQFNLIQSSKFPVVLGFPWLSHQSPIINWSSLELWLSGVPIASWPVSSLELCPQSLSLLVLSSFPKSLPSTTIWVRFLARGGPLPCPLIHLLTVQFSSFEGPSLHKKESSPCHKPRLKLWRDISKTPLQPFHSCRAQPKNLPNGHWNISVICPVSIRGFTLYSWGLGDIKSLSHLLKPLTPTSGQSLSLLTEYSTRYTYILT